MQLTLLVTACILCIIHARRMTQREFSDIKYLKEATNGEKLRAERVKNNTRISVSDISECPWMACIVRINCRRPTYGYNAVFVAASWVLSNDYVVAFETEGGEKKKNIKVISQTIDIYSGNGGGVSHRVKDIVFLDGKKFALLKVSDEHHDFIKMVKPSSWIPDFVTFHTIYYWNTYLDYIEYEEELILGDQSTCLSDNDDFCMDMVPFYNEHRMYGAVLVNADTQLVGFLNTPSDNNNPFEWFDQAAYLQPWVQETVLSSRAGNYDNA